MQKFDRILDGDNVTISSLVIESTIARQRGRFARSGRAGHEDLARDFLRKWCGESAVDRAPKNFDRVGNDAGYYADGVSLLEKIHAKTP